MSQSLQADGDHEPHRRGRRVEKAQVASGAIGVRKSHFWGGGRCSALQLGLIPHRKDYLAHLTTEKKIRVACFSHCYEKK